MSTLWSGPCGHGEYEIQPGDCLDNIAYHHGLLPEVIWTAPENAELREVRDSPFLLLPGDRIFIPELRLAYVECATDQRHHFIRRGVPSRYRLRLLKQGRPRADIAYRLIIDGRSCEGRTDDAGLLESSIPPDARGGELLLHPGTDAEESIPIRLGTLDPLNEISGIQGRLVNLGYHCRESGALDDETRVTLSEFQEDRELDITGEPDQATLTALKEAHGS